MADVEPRGRGGEGRPLGVGGLVEGRPQAPVGGVDAERPARLGVDERQLGFRLIDERPSRIDRIEIDCRLAVFLRDLDEGALGITFPKPPRSVSSKVPVRCRISPAIPKSNAMEIPCAKISTAAPLVPSKVLLAMPRKM